MLLIDHVYKKTRTVDQLPRRGRCIPVGQQEEYLGRFLCRFPGGYELWCAQEGLVVAFNVFDPDTRRVELAISGTRLLNNPRGFKIFGVYARPNNTVRAIELYEFLIRRFDLTLISDHTQSPGGKRIWAQLKRKSTISVYGYDFKRDQVIDVRGRNLDNVYVRPIDIERAEPGKIQQLKGRARNVRLVACRG